MLQCKWVFVAAALKTDGIDGTHHHLGYMACVCVRVTCRRHVKSDGITRKELWGLLMLVLLQTSCFNSNSFRRARCWNEIYYDFTFKSFRVLISSCQNTKIFYCSFPSPPPKFRTIALLLYEISRIQSIALWHIDTLFGWIIVYPLSHCRLTH